MSLLLVSCTGARPSDLGLSEGRLAPCPPTPNCVSSFAQDQEHRIEPLTLAVPPSEAWSTAQEVIRETPRTRMVSNTRNYLHAEYTSLVFRFVDDLELYLLADSSALAVRSASRVGRSDLGANRKRVEALRSRLIRSGVVTPPN